MMLTESISITNTAVYLGFRRVMGLKPIDKF